MKKVFVSSTTKDLGDARKKVCDSLVKLEILPVSMDYYTCDNTSPKKLDEEMVNGCDGCIILVGHLYGSSPPKRRKSFTHLEYEATIKSRKKLYPFLAADKFTYNSILRENDSLNKRLQAFRKRLVENHSVRYFNNIDHLCAEVLVCICKELLKNLKGER